MTGWQEVGSDLWRPEEDLTKDRALEVFQDEEVIITQLWPHHTESIKALLPTIM